MLLEFTRIHMTFSSCNNTWRCGCTMRCRHNLYCYHFDESTTHQCLFSQFSFFFLNRKYVQLISFEMFCPWANNFWNEKEFIPYIYKSQKSKYFGKFIFLLYYYALAIPYAPYHWSIGGGGGSLYAYNVSLCLCTQLHIAYIHLSTRCHSV